MNTETENRVTLRDLIFILFKHKTIILICLFSVIISVTLLAPGQKQVYTATTKLILKFGRENLYRDTSPDGTRTMLDFSSKYERMNTSMQILRSRDLLKRVIEDIGIGKIYPYLLYMVSPDNNTTPSIPPIEMAVDLFNFALVITPIEASSILQISFSHNNPVTAANAANTLVDHFLVKHLKIYGKPGEIMFFETQVDKFKKLLLKSENELNTFTKFNNVSSIQTQKNDLLNKISNFKSQIADSSIEISELEARLTLLNEKEASGETSQLNLDAITSIRSKVTTLKLEEQELLNKYKPNNMKIVNIRSEIEAGENLIASEERTYFKKEKISVQNQLDALNSKLSAQQEYLDIYQTELSKLDQVELQLKALERQIDLNEDRYELYSSRTEESRIQTEMDTLKIANISVVTKASPPLRPIVTGTPKSISVLISILMGLFLGISVALIIEFKSHSFNHREDIFKKLQLKALASIPEIKVKGSGLNTYFKKFNLQNDISFS